MYIPIFTYLEIYTYIHITIYVYANKHQWLECKLDIQLRGVVAEEGVSNAIAFAFDTNNKQIYEEHTHDQTERQKGN